MPQRIIWKCIVPNVKPHELIAELVRRAGGPLPAARAMGKVSFQPTLHRICAGDVRSPSRPSAERIAKHFKIEVDALYDERVATAEARRLGLIGGAPAPVDNAPSDPAPTMPSRDEVLEWLGLILATVPKHKRRAVAENLAGFAEEAGAEHRRSALLALLAEGPAAKVQAAA